MVHPPVVSGRQKLIVGLLFSALVLSSFWQRHAADADVAEVQGSAYGYFASVGLFGGPANEAGPDPTITLPAAGGNETASSPTGAAIFGPATIFSSGPLNVTTEGTTGADGSVTSTVSIEDINTSESEVFTADSMSSTCTASEAEATGSTTVANGTVILLDPDPEVSGEEGEEVVNVPADPAPNTTYEGTVANVNDNFRYVFNEQIQNPDGSITVNAAHQYLLGPTAVGDLIIGQVVCGVASQPGGGGDDDGDGDTTTTTGGQPGGSGQATTTTQPGQRSATTVAPSRPAPTTPAEPRFAG